MWRILVIVAVFGSIIGLPFLLRKEVRVMENPDAVVVVVTPHTESIRSEFGRGFTRWYRERTGLTVYVDYRNIGGTTEITRFLDSEYTNAFQNHWTRTLGRRWSADVQHGFSDRRLVLPEDPEEDTLAQSARRAFLGSSVSSGIDVFFGGGSYDFIQQNAKGQFISSGVLERFPQWFGEYPEGIPLDYGGEPFRDPDGLWFGAVLSSFGIIFNRDSLRRVGFDRDPETWEDLAHPRLFGEVAVADPTKSGAMNKAFEMIVQHSMQRKVHQFQDLHGHAPDQTQERHLVSEGWYQAFQTIQLISANSRYFTDTSQKPNIDVAAGDCAIGMTIDFYGRFQEETTQARGGGDRFGYVTPRSASTVSVDPIAVLRGAPNPETARLFVEYVMSPEGQALWNFAVGVDVALEPENPHSPRLRGPTAFALRRPPVAPLFYQPRFEPLRSDPTVNPYLESEGFAYRSDWTGHLFSEMRFIIRVAFIDLQLELRQAWGAILKARREGREEAAERALAVFQDLSAVDYAAANGRIKESLRQRNKIVEVRLARELSAVFRANYLQARLLADAR